MTICRKNAVLGQSINVSDSAIGDTIFVPNSGVVGVSGILSAKMVYANNVEVSVSGHHHSIGDVNTLQNVLDIKLNNDDTIACGFF